MIEVPIISLALFLVASIMIGLAIYSFINLKAKGGLEFCLLMISLTFYIAGYGFELLSTSKETILFWLKVEYLGITTIPAFCLILAVRLAGEAAWMKSWPVKLAITLSIINLVIYLTDPFHHLYYSRIGNEVKEIFTYYHEIEISKGLWYYINVIYLNLALLASCILFIRKLKMDFIVRRQSWLLIGGCLGPWIAHLVYQAGLTNHFDISPFGFLLTAPLFAWGVFGNYMVFLLPKARNSVYQSFGDSVIIIDNQKNIIDFNKTAGSLFKQLNRSSLGKPLKEVLDPFPELWGMEDGMDNQRMQCRFQIGNVKRTFVLANSFVTTQKCHHVGMIIALHEITDQVFLLDNLRESEEKYRLIFENTPVGVFQYDNSGKITTCNDAFVKIIGSSHELLIGLNLFNLPDTRMVDAVTASLSGKMGYYEHEYHSVTALKVTPVRGFFAPISTKTGQIRGGVGIIEDFTEKHQAESLIKYREEFESILISIELDFLNTEIGEMDRTFNNGLKSLGAFCQVDRAYIFRLDADGATVSNTHEWCSPGVPPEIQNLQSISLDVLPRWMEKLWNSEIIYIPDLAALTEDWKSEREILEAQGIKSLIVIPVEISGELLGFAGFDSVGESRTWNKDEISLLKVLGQIFASVIKRKEAHEELVLAKEKAEEASRVKSTFLANMSHEIRTPLNGILGFAELILTESTDQEIQKYSDIILSSGNRLLQTLSQILDLTRVESGKLDLMIDTVQVDKVIDEVIYLFSPTAKKKDLFIERQHGSVHLTLRLDDQLFRNSLINLISNAIKFTSQGGITISSAVEFTRGMRFGTIRVSDTGIGIQEKYFDTIFEDFKQVSEGVKRKYEGTGLGLSLTKRFVELSGGFIRVESLPGFGTTFILSFPYPDKE
ncbi:MAG: histidine kinase N-terminal 7TM domain-containing protein [Bacteroidales bacterium]|jgi:hypothetical protein